MASREIMDLHPLLQSLAKKFLQKCAEENLQAILIQTYRSKKEQDEDYARGRTAPGRKITNAKGGESPHNCCLSDGTPASCAFDFALYAPGGHSLDWDATDDQWEKAIEIGKDLGLISGSTFHGIPDYDHFQLANWKDISTGLSSSV